MSLDIEQIPVLHDNYIYLLRDRQSGACACIDPAVAQPVLERLQALGWRMSYIFNTHHHPDHVGGNLALKAATQCRIVGPAGEPSRIPGLDEAVGEGDQIRLGERVGQVLDVPGHTRDHIAFWFAEDKALFCGDTLFSLGCGRLFEGTPEQMWHSLAKIRALPDETQIFCAHEYTQANLRFALALEPGNADLQRRGQEIAERRARGLPTVPSRLGEEKAANPFLRPESPALQQSLNLPGAEPVTVFAAARAAKDRF